MPDGLAFEVAVQDDALHVVREHVCWNAEAFEAVNHPDEEVLLLGIREELDVAGTAMVAGHDKARTLEGAAGACHHIREAPVHLERIPRRRLVPAAAIPLRCNDLSLGRQEVFVPCNILFDDREAAGISELFEAFEDDRRIGNALAQKVVQSARES